MNRKVLATVLGLALFSGWSTAAEKTEPAELRQAIESLVDELVQQGVLPPEKSAAIVERVMQQVRRPVPAAAPPASGTPVEPPADSLSVPYIPEPVKQEIIEQIRPRVREDVVQNILEEAKRERWGMPDAFPAWVNRIGLFGDIRLRAQLDQYADGNATLFYKNIQRINERRSETSAPEDFINTTEDRDTARLRLRLGLLAKVTEELNAVARIATGSSSNPVSTNQTLGNSFRSSQLLLDQAFLRYQPPGLTLSGGRLPNPFLGTELIWDEDLNFDGVAATLSPWVWRAIEPSRDRFAPFLTLGAFPLQEFDLNRNDKWLYGAQLGFDWKFKKNKLSAATSYYRYTGIVGQQNAPGSDLLDYTAPQYVQKGNTLYDIQDPNPPADRPLYALASEFKELDFIASLDLAAFGATHVILTAHYVENLGFDFAEIFARTNGGAVYISPLEEDTRGSYFKLTVGAPKLQNQGDWQSLWGYRRLGADAVLDAFTDSDFHLGGTDAKGWVLGGSYTLANNTWLSLRYLTSDAIKGPPLGIDTWQLDINARF
ncbi:MAG: putative porin [Nevskiales bacterium]|nr:putative porin [Nevskiales bacterium]